jgi:serine-type D-Ala-D-Ala carboxypeptidase/endopeptidase (penicillin-binding protein 4)
VKRRVAIFVGALLCGGMVGLVEAASLPLPVVTALKEAHIPQADIGIEVREVTAKKALLSLNPDRAMNPASTMKLLTTYAGLELLGPAYTWKTEALTNGRLENGVLQGDLIIKGYGDPKFTIDQLWLWLQEIKGRGVHEIRGNVVMDSSAFNLPAFDPGAFDNDPLRAYNVGPDALLVNFNAVNFNFIPEGGKVNVFVQPEFAGIALDNRLTATAGECLEWNGDIHPQLQDHTLLVEGAMPASCGEHHEYISLMPHAAYVNAVFRALWQELGGKLTGEVKTGTAPAGAVLLSTHQSAPLSELIRDINKFSNNVMARELFLTLGMGAGLPANLEQSDAALRAWLAQNKLEFSELELDNGSGLSRKSRISAHSLASLLRAAYNGPWQAEFTASLPIAGIDGTLKKHFQEGPAKGYAHLKTGSLEGVKAIAGYVQSKSGKVYVVVFFINHSNAKAGWGAAEALVGWVRQH